MKTDQEILELEAAAFHRGIRACIRLLVRRTPLAKGAIEHLRELLRVSGAEVDV